jgi:hypothetical protein
MRRLVGVLAAASLVLMLAGPVAAQVEPHGHMLVQHPEFGVVLVDGEPWFGVTSIRKCVDLAAGRHLPLHAHHDTIHTGKAGVMLAERADIHIVPTFEFANCAELEAALPIAFFPLGE